MQDTLQLTATCRRPGAAACTVGTASDLHQLPQRNVVAAYGMQEMSDRVTNLSLIDSQTVSIYRMILAVSVVACEHRHMPSIAVSLRTYAADAP